MKMSVSSGERNIGCEFPVHSCHTWQKQSKRGRKASKSSVLLGHGEAEHHSAGNMWQRNFVMADRKQRAQAWHNHPRRSWARCSSQGHSPALLIPTSHLSPPPCHGVEIREVRLGQTSVSPLSMKAASWAHPQVSFSGSWGLPNPIKLTIKINSHSGMAD